MSISAKQAPSAVAALPTLATRVAISPGGSERSHFWDAGRPERSSGNHESAAPIMVPLGVPEGPGGVLRVPEEAAQGFQTQKTKKRCDAKKQGFAKPPCSKTPMSGDLNITGLVPPGLGGAGVVEGGGQGPGQ